MKKILLIAMRIGFMASAVSTETEGRRLATLAFLGLTKMATVMQAWKSNSTERKISLSPWTPITTAT